MPSTFKNFRAIPLVLLLSTSIAVAQSSSHEETVTADTIVAKVAANQDQAQSERSHYVYVQHAKVTSRKSKTVMCEELTDIRVTPSSTGSHQQLIKLDGRVLDPRRQDRKDAQKYAAYNTLLPDKDNPDPIVDGSHDSITVEIGETDRSLVENIRNGLTNNTGGSKDEAPKDGIGANLFPLTSKTQTDYAFTLIGREQMNGREVFHLTFRPKDKNDFSWKGDAYIDSAAYQPVVVSTTMNRKLPFAVRTLLGTSLPGLGFTVVYAPQPAGDPNGIWFPMSFSTEFKIKVLFFFNREIKIDAKNRDFQKTHGEGKIIEAEPDPGAPQDSSSPPSASPQNP